MWSQCPPLLFVAAVLPLCVMVPLQYWVFLWSSKANSRQNRVDVEATAATGEVLREIKMVRQFAMEKAESVKHARAQLVVAAGGRAAEDDFLFIWGGSS